MSTSPDDPDAPYLPERYRKQVKAKKQRRLYKKLVTAGSILVVLIVAYLLLSGMLMAPQSSPPTQNPVTPAPATGDQATAPVVNVTTVVTPGYATGTGISALQSPGVLSQDKAVEYLRYEYPADTYSLIRVNLTDRYAGLLVYEFSIRPVDPSSAGTPFTVLDNAVTGEPYTPGQESARTTRAQALDIVRKAFSAIPSDRVSVRYAAGPDSGGLWNFTIVKGNTRTLTGTLDAETERISSFTRSIDKLGRQAEPGLDISSAEKIATQYISDQNGPVAVNMSNSRYLPLGSPSDPMAGEYVFTYNRIVNEIPCDEDGFIVGVDAVNGEISSYERHWRSPDNAFSVTSEPLVLKREATFSVLQRAKETYPESVNGLRIVSAELRWKDQHAYGVTPRPGGIPLAWKVVFDDEIIRTKNPANPAVAWVDGQTGNILDFEYQH